jgi:pimeloyl-ACP methyl ester carboxylesterase
MTVPSVPSVVRTAGLPFALGALAAVAAYAAYASNGQGAPGTPARGTPARGTDDAAAAADQRPSHSKPAVILVHGAFADGSSWARVILLLEREGYRVTAVQNPLTSLADDVATTRRVIRAQAQAGPVVVVGHSYGGAVVTEAAAGEPGVKALVYVAAFAPDAGESVADLNARFAPAPLAAALSPDAAGSLYVDRARFRDVFCADLPAPEASVLAATQKPVAGACFTAPAGAAAWRATPSWYLVARDDRAIGPDLQRFLARRMGARVTEVKSSHVPFLSHPEEVARLIEQAGSEKR